MCSHIPVCSYDDCRDRPMCLIKEVQSLEKWKGRWRSTEVKSESLSWKCDKSQFLWHNEYIYFFYNWCLIA